MFDEKNNSLKKDMSSNIYPTLPPYVDANHMIEIYQSEDRKEWKETGLKTADFEPRKYYWTMKLIIYSTTDMKSSKTMIMVTNPILGIAKPQKATQRKTNFVQCMYAMTLESRCNDLIIKRAYEKAQAC